MATGDDLIVFLYDDKGTPYGMFTVLDGVQQYFFYLYNAQGDVIAIIDDYAERVVNYEYSAWGELLSVTGSKADTVGVLNPVRYRGYCYDTETGLYYVSSRYYDPAVGRWINADGLVSTGQGILGNNMFAYCLNNPVNYEDSDGEMAATAGALACGVAAGGANAWNPAGWIILGATAIAAIGILVIPWDNVGQSISKGWNKVKSSARSASISRSISKAVSKAKTKIRNEKNDMITGLRHM